MSLLLDALKKAAEQKAAKSKQDESADTEATDTGLEAAAGDAEDSSLPRHRLEDETELDYAELDTRFRRVHGAGDGTETGLDVDDYTDSSLHSADRQAKSGEDETMIFSVDDVAENVAEDSSPPPAAGDETDLSMLAADPVDAGGIEVDEIDSSRLDGDETDLSQLIAEQYAANRSAAEDAAANRSDGDETDLSQLIAEQAEATRGAAADDDAIRPDSDETDLSLHAGAGDAERASFDDRSTGGDAGDPGLAEQSGDQADELRPGAGADTGVSPPSPQASDFAGQDSVDEDADPIAAQPDDDDAGSEDMSLMLVEREPTQITSPRSTTSRQSPQDALQSLQAEAPTAEDLGLIETTRYRPGDEPSAAADSTQTRNRTGSTATTRNRASNTATTGIATATATATANLGHVPRPDPHAAQSHAPDNYDRTLMRLPSDEASKLFTGIGSGSDVVMTPDYAKQVFRSKSSAMRLQHAKIYSGIAIAILLAVGVYGILEYQRESENIEASLRPLKNDPMPGAIRTEATGVEPDPLFAEAEVNERALEILQNAKNLEPQAAAGEPPPAEAEPAGTIAAADGNDAAASGTPGEVDAVPRKTAVTPGAADEAASTQAVAVSGPPTTGRARPASVGTSVAVTGTPTSGGSRLQIESRERLEEKQVLLREAYEAFRAGDDALALQRYNRVLEIDPDNRNALLARGAIRVHNGNGAAAIQDYQALLLANPKDSLAMASLLAVANVSPLESETQLKLMLRDEPDSPHLNFALANAYAARQRWHEAQRYYFTALQNNPEDPNYAYNLAVSLEHISQPKAAISYYRRALENYNKGLATFSRDAVGRRLEKLANS